MHSGSGAASVALANALSGANARYGVGLSVEMKKESASRFSDHSSFWDSGYPAFLAIENFYPDAIAADRNPYYHNTGDLLSRVRLDYVARYTQAALATVVELAGMRSAHVPPPTATATATMTPSPSLSPTATPTPGGVSQACRDAIVNGGMEAANGWTFGRTSRPAAYVTAPVFSGLRSLRLGIDASTSDRRSHSSAYQRLSIPADAVSAVLSARIRRGTAAATGDYQEILVLNSNYRLVRTLMRTLTSDAAWQVVRYDLTNQAGRPVFLYMNVYNDGNGRRTWMHADDVQLTVCTP